MHTFTLTNSFTPSPIKSLIRLPAATNKHINSRGRGLVGYSPVYHLEGLGLIAK